VKRLIGLRVSTLNRLVLYREKTENYYKFDWFLLGLGWWAEALMQLVQQLLQLVFAYDIRFSSLSPNLHMPFRLFHVENLLACLRLVKHHIEGKS
jgi:hypothetical protein